MLKKTAPHDVLIDWKASSQHFHSVARDSTARPSVICNSFERYGNGVRTPLWCHGALAYSVGAFGRWLGWGLKLVYRHNAFDYGAERIALIDRIAIAWCNLWRFWFCCWTSALITARNIFCSSNLWERYEGPLVVTERIRRFLNGD